MTTYKVTGSIRKKKIYLDTSVISYLRQEDTPERMSDTLILWEELKKGVYHIYISDVTIDELSACSEPKRTELFARLAEIDYNEIKVAGDDEIAKLAREIIDNGILTDKSLDDCLHIAAAMLNGCNVIVSWNFKHLVNIKTIDGVRMISLVNNLTPIDIYSPQVLLERGT